MDSRSDEVFLSHASSDRPFVEELAERLSAQRIRYFYSKVHIKGAMEWHDELGAALERCTWFVLVLSPSAVKSTWVKRELLFALQSKRYRNRILPVVLSTCKPAKLSWTLSGFQHIDFRKDTVAATKALLRALKQRK